MEIKIKFNDGELVFGEWEQTLIGDTFSLRRNCIPKMDGTYIEWILDERPNGMYLFRNFQGEGEAAGLYSLIHVYDRMYPGITFGMHQMEEAKNNMDEFLIKFNSLKAFL